MFKKVLIANRGEIACRIAKTLREMDIRSLAVYSEADLGSLHVTLCDEAVCIGPAQASQSYLDAEKLLQAAKAHGAEAIHPGYGFLSENADFADACAAASIVFIGPTPRQMRDFGLKHTARELALKSGAPLLPGTGLLAGPDEASLEAARIGFPVMLKSTAGGGGIGMQIIRHAEGLQAAWDTVSRLSQSNFKHGGIYLEKYVEHARHIEVQVFGDGQGQVIALGERDCSTQRRNQKVIEETPAPNLSDALRKRLAETAVSLCRTVDYQGAGTVEFVVDAASGKSHSESEPEGFYFLEVNTRLQVEHGVTEAVTGLDLVEAQIRLAAGELSDLETLRRIPQGHSIQARVYAENPRLEFRPSAGQLTEVIFPVDTRVDTWVETGTDVSPYYDPLLAKVIVHGRDRSDALEKLGNALSATRLEGIETNLEFLRALSLDPVFRDGAMTTRYLGSFRYLSRTVDVIQPGPQSSIQDYPGRVGYWAVGVPPSGPFDALSFRWGNRLLDNDDDAAGLEMTVAGATLRFQSETWAVLTGAQLPAMLEGIEVPFWKTFRILAGSTLRMGAISGPGMRTYLCVQGGFYVPAYMGSRSTFTLGKFGGHGGRILRTGDVLHLSDKDPVPQVTLALPQEMRPLLSHAWDIGVLYGPHGEPDYFDLEGIVQFFAATWEVHYNSNRTGIRLVGPKPIWARQDGGEAGLHPSNIHENAYAIGSVDFTGDMPILLGPDGPSLGGFVCPAVICQSELWKMGQLKPGDKIRFRKMTLREAEALESAQENNLLVVGKEKGTGTKTTPTPPVTTQATTGLRSMSQGNPSVTVSAHPEDSRDNALLHLVPAHGQRVETRFRRSGDRNILVEFGPPILDINLRFRAHALMQRLEELGVPGILDLTPGIRSLQIHIDSRVLTMQKALQMVADTEAQLPVDLNVEVQNRIVHMPLSWDDEAIHAVIRKYMQSVRADAPWCPSNIEFIRRINGLDSIADVYKTVFDADFLVMGLGDVYLGAPVATPLDPRHRLVTTKYNPARTWTVENVVGIGGAYMCIYGMEGPGGYQLFGRTSQVWNTYKTSRDIQPGKPWLLRFFDQIRFFPVSAKELTEFRADFAQGRATLRVEPHRFHLGEYNRFLEKEKTSIQAFRNRQRDAFAEERERWKIAEAEADAKTESTDLASSGGARPEHVELSGESESGIAVEAHISGNVWKILVSSGQQVAADEPLMILESMKMEFTVHAPTSGKIVKVVGREGHMVQSGQTLLFLES